MISADGRSLSPVCRDPLSRLCRPSTLLGHTTIQTLSTMLGKLPEGPRPLSGTMGPISVIASPPCSRFPGCAPSWAALRLLHINQLASRSRAARGPGYVEMPVGRATDPHALNDILESRETDGMPPQ